MKNFPAFALLLLALGACQQQTETTSSRGPQSEPVTVPCRCPSELPVSDTRPDTTFQFSNGQAISVCGLREQVRNLSYYSEFAVSGCQTNQVLKYWDARQRCQLAFGADTLTVESLLNLPAGPNFRYTLVPFIIDQFYPLRNGVRYISNFNRGIRPYAAADLRRISKDYARLPELTDAEKLELANRLFVASLGGDDTSASSFRQLKSSFAGGSANAAEYAELNRLLVLWQRGGTPPKS
ncbi:hypothetical protein LJY25_01330 [Hymenobacter sp. BT175]|uniref:hypothetical protein n=1 Tax=Hymenobacter translucens TaxID=2886507 RepID=UPI001D0EFFDA|nr:hypothetical protein [Hymenobacter translucens]MCC2545072.1 hypothetical protein [Hymenobacter translucens]